MFTIPHQPCNRIEEDQTQQQKQERYAPTINNETEYTFFGSSSPLLAKRKKPVSIPKVSTTSNNATIAYILVITPYPPEAAGSEKYKSVPENSSETYQ